VVFVCAKAVMIKTRRPTRRNALAASGAHVRGGWGGVTTAGCERERGRPVNFVAVDYTTIGDAGGAVDELDADR
jgi:hypothetical protein